MSETTPSARSIMTARGDGAKQVWATEFGAPTGSTTRDLTEAAQAQLVTDSYAKLKAWSWAGPSFFYSYRDNGTNKSDVEQNFGILHFDWSPKLSYTAYQTAAAAG
jgi:exo-beta-1,3-glucanase (GH17 family)